MKRRTFIWTPLLLSLGSALRLDAQANTTAVLDDSMQTECAALLSCFSNPADAAQVGQRYLAEQVEPVEVAQLMRDIGRPNSGSDRPAALVSAQFEAAKRRDFTLGNTVCLNGWVLSKAEASLCALAYLSPLNV